MSLFNPRTPRLAIKNTTLLEHFILLSPETSITKYLISLSPLPQHRWNYLSPNNENVSDLKKVLYWLWFTFSLQSNIRRFDDESHFKCNPVVIWEWATRRGHRTNNHFPPPALQYQHAPRCYYMYHRDLPPHRVPTTSLPVAATAARTQVSCCHFPQRRGSWKGYYYRDEPYALPLHGWEGLKMIKCTLKSH